MQEGQGDMWILDSYGCKRDWLSPSNEKVAIWPNLSTERALYTKDDIALVQECIAKFTGTLNPIRSDYRVFQVPIGTGGSVLSVCITSDVSKLHTMFPPGSTLVDIDSNLSLSNIKYSFVAVAKVCTIRFDDLQHMILAVEEGRVVWEAWTIQEEFLSTHRVATRTIRLNFNRTIFVFDRSGATFCPDLMLRLHRVYRTLFKFLPDDVISIIVKNVHASRNQMSSRQFHSGGAAGVFNYAIARLFRIAWFKNDALHQVPSLQSFMQMSETDRKGEYDKIRRTYRQRHQLFDRQACHKYTRSGRVY